MIAEWLDALLQQLLAAPEWLVYVVLASFAALENVFPPLPADMVILFGGFLAGQGGVRLWAAFLCVWLFNVVGALLVYLAGRLYGARFFAHSWGRHLLQPQQLRSLDQLYRRHGFKVIFLSRFLPMFRAVVPVFAGASGLPLWKTAIPLALASALWYGPLVYLGALAGRNWEVIFAQLQSAGVWLWLIALAFGGAVIAWWWRSRL